ncbi:MAG: PKD domain-containing protein [Planctomycetes bacterium]|nr:PKD domain-containing protein [Planctomycetota bacterium]
MDRKFLALPSMVIILWRPAPVSAQAVVAIPTTQNICAREHKSCDLGDCYWACACQARVGPIYVNDALSYRFDWENDGSFDSAYSPANTAIRSFSRSANVKVEVADGRAAYSYVLSIVVRNHPPVAVLDEPAGDAYLESESIPFKATSSRDPDGDPLTYRWTSDRDGEIGQSASFSTPLSVGLHAITLKVSDGQDAAEEETVLRVLAHPRAFIDDIIPGYPIQGAPVQFNGHGEDDDGAVAGYSWTSDRDGFLSDQASFTTRTLSAGTHTITFTVRDDDGLWSAPAAQTLVVTQALGSGKFRKDLGNLGISQASGSLNGFGKLWSAGLSGGGGSPHRRRGEERGGRRGRRCGGGGGVRLGAADNCPGASNPDQEDADADGQGGARDRCPYDPENDGEGDGYCRSEDNCPSLFNPDQLDADGNGRGDACEGQGRRLPGDCNADSTLDLSDGICIFGVLFLGDPPRFPCGGGAAGEEGNLSLLDWQPDGKVDLTDGIAVLRFLFLGDQAHHLAAPGMETEACVPMAGCGGDPDCR